jgi:hypothetical protein
MDYSIPREFLHQPARWQAAQRPATFRGTSMASRMILKNRFDYLGEANV